MNTSDSKHEKAGSISSSFSSDPPQDTEFGKSGYDIDRSNGGSALYAYFNLTCLTLGTGMLGLPASVKNAGWGGLALIILAWLMGSYSGIILQRTMYKGKTRRLASYKEMGDEAFGKIGGWISFFFLTWMLIGTPILYLVLAAANLNQLCAGTAGEIGTFKWTIVWCVIVGIPYIFIKSMKEIALSSLIGAVTMIGTVLITIVLTGIDAPNHVGTVQHENVIWEGFPVALSTIAYAAGSNLIYANVEGSMKNPKKWPIVVVSSLTTCEAIYLALSICGYYVYGDKLVNPVYNSTPDGPARIAAIVLVTLHVVIACPLLLVSFALDVEDMMNITVERLGKKKEFLVRAGFRTATMIFVAVIGVVIPFFDVLMSLLGAFSNSALVFILPVLFYWKLDGFRNKPIYELAWGALVLLYGLVALIFGTWAAVDDLVSTFANGYHYQI
ncbi:transmembrane amino acid transporter protein-domain-containing protein [Phascolomyces articulosus]|uniref:Transmembrane amino acid transporter protein-domain-containing protein n=1 Tax=Phascolomyces articulosus TaxID=60185 RepID=A0AAD5PM31_9FUNG|nr:transmembrane amino acid transporter protein-domain-containing protein [Phascolomyces articulosus]